MADQQRWFKLWYSALSDDAIQALTPALRWAWAALGCHTKVHGTHGRVVIYSQNKMLAAAMGVDPDMLLVTVKALPNVCVDVVHEEGKSGHGAFAVTWKNWTKYQEDTTQAERQRTSRAKRRREERRAEQRRHSPPETPSPGSPTDEAASESWPPSLEDVRARLDAIQAPAVFLDPGYWARIDAWLGPEDSGVSYLVELDKYLAWIASLPPRQQDRDHRRGFRNWLTKSERDATERRRRDAQGQTRFRR